MDLGIKQILMMIIFSIFSICCHQRYGSPSIIAVVAGLAVQDIGRCTSNVSGEACSRPINGIAPMQLVGVLGDKTSINACNIPNDPISIVTMN